jgi:CheY-like chemotaxis protein
METNDKKDDLLIDVIDSGIGISQEQISHLFQPFSQGDASMSRKHGGTGLGLIISKKLANILDGDISVSSEANQGSVFTLRIPALPASEPVSNERVKNGCVQAESSNMMLNDLSGMRILLAEDGIDNQRLFRVILTQSGAVVEIAENGKIATEKGLSDEERFDLILMDMQMPVMDGYDATRELREKGFRKPIIALTAHAMTGDEKKCLDAGCDAYLTKPIDRKRFIQAIMPFKQKRNAGEKLFPVAPKTH